MGYDDAGGSGAGRRRGGRGAGAGRVEEEACALALIHNGWVDSLLSDEEGGRGGGVAAWAVPAAAGL